MDGIVDKPQDDSAANSRGGKAGTANTSSSVYAPPVARKLALWSSMQVETYEKGLMGNGVSKYHSMRWGDKRTGN